MRKRTVHRAPVWKIARAMSKIDPKGYYASLGVDPSATLNQIRAAYHRCAKQGHPDLDLRPQAKARFQAINEAYQTLSNPGRRAAYDSSRWAAAAENYETRLASVRWRRAELGGRSHALKRKLALSVCTGVLGLVSLALLLQDAVVPRL